MYYPQLIGKTPSWIDQARDKVEMQFILGPDVLVTSRSERSRLTHIDGDVAGLLDDAITTATSTSHYDDGITYFALHIGTASGYATFHWNGPGYIPFDVEVL